MADDLSFGWNTEAARYVDLRTGRFVSQDYVLSVMQGRLDEGFERLQDMLVAVIDGGAPIDAWQEAFATELRRMHTQLAALGRGGWAQMTPSDWGYVGQQLRFEYEHLREFAADIASGRLSESQIAMRMQMYAEHGWTSFWQAHTTAKAEVGFNEERRIRNAVESCGDCLNYETMGWQPIGTLPEPGQSSQCGARCKCNKEYRKSEMVVAA